MFFTEKDISTKLKDNFTKSPDEYMTNPLALSSKEHATMDIQSNLAISKQHIFMLLTSFTKIKEIIENIAENYRTNAANMIYLGKELK
jgi:hypothetical protein